MRWLADLALVVLILFVVAFTYRSTDGKIADVANETHGALCAFKVDLQRRATDTRKILREHPGPVVRIYGLRIPRSELRTSLRNQQRTLRALRQLDCSERSL